MNSLVDPFVMAERFGEVVSSGEKREYFRFRPAPFYGGIATVDCVGCCPKCLFCWSWNIIVQPEKVGQFYSPQEVARNLLSIAKKKGFSQVRISGNEPTLHRSHLLQVRQVIRISFTFNEPILWFEYTVDAAKFSKAQGLHTNYVTNGFITEKAFDEIAPFLDVYRVDIKGFTEETYTRIGHIKEFKGILEITKKAKKYGMHVEVVTNVISGVNDSETEIRCIGSWIKDSLGPEVPWHVTRFYPHFELTRLSPTPVSKLERAWSIGKEEGLWYVYLGNIPGHRGENTYCHRCGELLIERHVFDIIKDRMVGNRCPQCNAVIPGRFGRKG